MKKKMHSEFNKFVNLMEERMNYGQMKYGDDYKEKDIQKELLDEATDLANYAFLLYLKAKRFNEKCRKE